jgi:hypothetical protein
LLGVVYGCCDGALKKQRPPTIAHDVSDYVAADDPASAEMPAQPSCSMAMSLVILDTAGLCRDLAVPGREGAHARIDRIQLQRLPNIALIVLTRSSMARAWRQLKRNSIQSGSGWARCWCACASAPGSPTYGQAAGRATLAVVD